VKWQDSGLGKYIEFKIKVFYQEGHGSDQSGQGGAFNFNGQQPMVSPLANNVQFAMTSPALGSQTKTSNIYQWEIFKRYSNFVDLCEALQPFFLAEGITPPELPPKIEIGNNSLRNQALTERKKQLQGYIRQVLKTLSHRMPPHLLVFLGIHE
jgi:hypothetical protein